MVKITRVLALAASFLFAAAASAPALAAPAWWRVSDGRSEVWVLGAPTLAPAGMAWDTAAVERRLSGASALIIAAQPRGQVLAFAGLIKSAFSPTPMESGLDPALRRRFEAISAAVGQSPGHYAAWKPAMAGVMLEGDYYKAVGVKSGEIEATVRRIARDDGVRETPAAYYDASALAGAAEALSPAGQQLCLGAALHNLEANGPRIRQIAADWSRGRPAAPPPDGSDLACIAAMPQLKALNDRNLTAESAAIAQALGKPGRTVAVFDLQRLTMPNGVLDRLRARGLSVSGPTP